MNWGSVLLALIPGRAVTTGLVAGWLLAGVPPLSAGAHYVHSGTGIDSNPGTSALPWLTLHNSVPKLGAGDTLHITGTFSESPGYGMAYTFTVSGSAAEPIVLQGQDGTIDVQASSDFGGTYYFTGNYVVIDGLRVTSSLSAGVPYGGAFGFAGNYCTVQNCEFFGMTGSHTSGGADHLWCIINQGNYNTFSNLYFHEVNDADLFRIWGHHNLITRCVIRNCVNPNYDNCGGGACLHADLIQFWGGTSCDAPSHHNVFENSRFENSTISGGMLASNSTSNTPCANTNDWVYRNNIFVGTGSQAQAIQVAADRMHLYNNVFYQMPLAIDIFATYFGNQAFYNNVFIGSGIRDSYRLPGAVSVATNAWDAAAQSYTQNDFRGWYRGGFITVDDPGFVDAAAGDFHLLSTSVLRGQGTNLANDSSASRTDFDGQARPADAAWDLGAYQYVPAEVQRPLTGQERSRPYNNGLYLNPVTSAAVKQFMQMNRGLQAYDLTGNPLRPQSLPPEGIVLIKERTGGVIQKATIIK